MVDDEVYTDSRGIVWRRSYTRRLYSGYGMLLQFIALKRSQEPTAPTKPPRARGRLAEPPLDEHIHIY